MIDENYITAIGLVAAFLTTVAFLPQVIKTWRTKSAKDLSLGMFGIFTVGVFLWLIYGFLVNDLPIIMANIFTLTLSSIILFFKIRHG